jgi:MOSC domain-containing protein YiiM
MINHGQLRAIWIKRMHRGPMEPAPTASLVAGRGIVGNANQGGRRQVTLIEEEVWESLMEQLDSTLDPSTRRANLLLRGVPLAESSGRILRVGSCRIRITGETKPCHVMEAALPGLREAMYPGWRGGAFGQIIEGGEIAVGDPAYWEDEA